MRGSCRGYSMINRLWFWWHMRGIDCRGWFGERVKGPKAHFTIWGDE